MHSESGCGGSFVRVLNPETEPGEAADAVVCTGCGAHADMEAMHA